MYRYFLSCNSGRVSKYTSFSVQFPYYVSVSGSSALSLTCQSTHPEMTEIGLKRYYDGQKLKAESVITININFSHEFINK